MDIEEDSWVEALRYVCKGDGGCPIFFFLFMQYCLHMDGLCEQYWAVGLRGSVENHGLCVVLRPETPETRLVSEGGETTSPLIA